MATEGEPAAGSRPPRAYESPGGVDGKSTNWETPWDLFEALDSEFRFICDAAAEQGNTKVPGAFISPEEDGLAVDWPRGSVWLNPPYGKALSEWVAKARAEAERGVTVVVLVPVRSSTKWWHEHVPHATEVRLMIGRIQFIGAGVDGDERRASPFPSAVLVFTPLGGPPRLRHVDLPRGGSKGGER